MAVEREHVARLVAAEMKVGKYGDHFPDDTFVPLAVETYGCTVALTHRAVTLEFVEPRVG
jgi:hypothetical protein